MQRRKVRHITAVQVQNFYAPAGLALGDKQHAFVFSLESRPSAGAPWQEHYTSEQVLGDLHLHWDAITSNSLGACDQDNPADQLPTGQHQHARLSIYATELPSVAPCFSLAFPTTPVLAVPGLVLDSAQSLSLSSPSPSVVQGNPTGDATAPNSPRAVVPDASPSAAAAPVSGESALAATSQCTVVHTAAAVRVDSTGDASDVADGGSCCSSAHGGALLVDEAVNHHSQDDHTVVQPDSGTPVLTSPQHGHTPAQSASSPEQQGELQVQLHVVQQADGEDPTSCVVSLQLRLSTLELNVTHPSCDTQCVHKRDASSLVVIHEDAAAGVVGDTLDIAADTMSDDDDGLSGGDGSGVGHGDQVVGQGDESGSRVTDGIDELAGRDSSSLSSGGGSVIEHTSVSLHHPDSTSASSHQPPLAPPAAAAAKLLLQLEFDTAHLVAIDAVSLAGMAQGVNTLLLHTAEGGVALPALATITTGLSFLPPSTLLQRVAVEPLPEVLQGEQAVRHHTLQVAAGDAITTTPVLSNGNSGAPHSHNSALQHSRSSSLTKEHVSVQRAGTSGLPPTHPHHRSHSPTPSPTPSQTPPPHVHHSASMSWTGNFLPDQLLGPGLNVHLPSDSTVTTVSAISPAAKPKPGMHRRSTSASMASPTSLTIPSPTHQPPGNHHGSYSRQFQSVSARARSVTAGSDSSFRGPSPPLGTHPSPHLPTRLSTPADRVYDVEDLQASTRRLQALHQRLVQVRLARQRARQRVLQVVEDGAAAHQQQVALHAARHQLCALTERAQAAVAQLEALRQVVDTTHGQLKHRCTEQQAAARTLKAAHHRLNDAVSALKGPDGMGTWRALHAHMAGRVNALVAGLASVYELGPRGASIAVRPAHADSHTVSHGSSSNGHHSGVHHGVVGLSGHQDVLVQGMGMSPRFRDTEGDEGDVDDASSTRSRSSWKREKPPLPLPTSMSERARQHTPHAGAASQRPPRHVHRHTPSLDEVLATQPLELQLDAGWWTGGTSGAPSVLDSQASVDSSDADLDEVIQQVLCRPDSPPLPPTKPDPAHTHTPSRPGPTAHPPPPSRVTRPAGLAAHTGTDSTGRHPGPRSTSGDTAVCVLGLDLPANLSKRSLEGSVGWGSAPDEEQRVAAALGYVAHMVDRISAYTGVSLRYPVLPNMSKSHICDPCPLTPPVQHQPTGLLQRSLGRLLNSVPTVMAQPSGGGGGGRGTTGDGVTDMFSTFTTPSQWLLGNVPTGLLHSSGQQQQPPQHTKGQGQGSQVPGGLVGVPSHVVASMKTQAGMSILPLYTDGRDRTRFAYAVYLLNKNVELLMQAHGLASNGPNQLLRNLYTLALAAASGANA